MYGNNARDTLVCEALVEVLLLVFHCVFFMLPHAGPSSSYGMGAVLVEGAMKSQALSVPSQQVMLGAARYPFLIFALHS